MSYVPGQHRVCGTTRHKQGAGWELGPAAGKRLSWTQPRTQSVKLHHTLRNDFSPAQPGSVENKPFFPFSLLGAGRLFSVWKLAIGNPGLPRRSDTGQERPLPSNISTNSTRSEFQIQQMILTKNWILIFLIRLFHHAEKLFLYHNLSTEIEEQSSSCFPKFPI